MKLIELLARELKEWPEDAVVIAQDGDRDVWSWTTEPVWGDEQWCLGDNARLVDNIGVYDELATDYSTAKITRADWHVYHEPATVTDQPLPATPTLETMLTEWRNLEARAQAAQAEADALFEHAGQCHGEIVVRLAELGWGAPRMVPGEPVVTLDEIEPWVIGGHAAPDDATHYGEETRQFNEGFYKLRGDDWMFRTTTGSPWLNIGKRAGGDDTSRWISRPSTQP